MRLFFARHGETDWNAEKRIQGSRDVPLNAAGRAQAQNLIAQIRRECPTLSVVYTSPLKRAEETARIVAEALQRPCHVLNGLAEIDFGDWEGMTWASVDASDPEGYAYYCKNRRTARPPKGESCQDVLDRMLPDLKQTLAEEKGDILFVTHSAILKALLCLVQEQPFSSITAAYTLGNAEAMELDCEAVLKKL